MKLENVLNHLKLNTHVIIVMENFCHAVNITEKKKLDFKIKVQAESCLMTAGGGGGLTELRYKEIPVVSSQTLQLRTVLLQEGQFLTGIHCRTKPEIHLYTPQSLKIYFTSAA